MLISTVFGINVFLWLIALLRHRCKSMGSSLDSTFDLWDWVDLINLLLLALQLLQRIFLELSFPMVTEFSRYASTTSCVDFERCHGGLSGSACLQVSML